MSPVPQSNESKHEFLKRCTLDGIANGKSPEASFAACNLEWRNSRGGEENLAADKIWFERILFDFTKEGAITMKGKDVKPQPKNFAEALAVFLNQGVDIDSAIDKAVKSYPQLYEAYCKEILVQ